MRGPSDIGVHTGQYKHGRWWKKKKKETDGFSVNYYERRSACLNRALLFQEAPFSVVPMICVPRPVSPVYFLPRNFREECSRGGWPRRALRTEPMYYTERNSVIEYFRNVVTKRSRTNRPVHPHETVLTKDHFQFVESNDDFSPGWN